MSTWLNDELFSAVSTRLDFGLGTRLGTDSGAFVWAGPDT